MTNRRGFLGIVAGGIASAPAMAKQAVSELSTLDSKLFGGMIPHLGVGTASSGDQAEETGYADVDMPKGPYVNEPYLRSRSTSKYLKESILDHVYRDPKAIEFENRTYGIQSLSPHLAEYRSFSMSTKIRLSRQDQAEHSRHLQLQKLELEYQGIFDDETDRLKDKSALGLLEDLPSAITNKLADALLQLPFRKR